MRRAGHPTSPALSSPPPPTRPLSLSLSLSLSLPFPRPPSLQPALLQHRPQHRLRGLPVPVRAPGQALLLRAG